MEKEVIVLQEKCVLQEGSWLLRAAEFEAVQSGHVKVMSAKSTTRDYESENDDLLEEIEALKKKLATAEAKLAEHANAPAPTNSDDAKLMAVIAKLTDENEAFQKTIAENIVCENNLKSDLQRLRELLDASEASNSNLTEQLKKAEDDLKAAAAEYAAQSAAKDKKISELEQEIRDMTASENTLKETIISLQSELDRIRDLLAASEAANVSLTVQLKKAQDDLNAAVAAHDAQIAVKDKRIAELEALLADRDSKLQENADKMKTAPKYDDSKLMEVIVKLTEENEKLQHTIGDRNASITDLQAEIDRLRAEVKQKDQAFSVLEKTIAELKANLEKMVRELQAEIERLKSEIAKKDEEYDCHFCNNNLLQ